MTPLPHDEHDPQTDCLLDQAILELREVTVPVMPSIEFPTTFKPAFQRKSLARTWSIAAAWISLAGVLVWQTENWWPFNQPAIVVPPVALESKQVLPKLQSEFTQLEQQQVVRESTLPPGLVSRSEIQMVSIDTHTAKAILTDLDRLQFEIDQLAEHIHRVEIDDRAQKLLDELHRMVTTAH